MSNCVVVTFPLLSWVRCGAWLYGYLIFALFLTLNYCLCTEAEMDMHLKALDLDPATNASLSEFQTKMILKCSFTWEFSKWKMAHYRKYIDETISSWLSAPINSLIKLCKYPVRFIAIDYDSRVGNPTELVPPISVGQEACWSCENCCSFSLHNLILRIESWAL